MTSKYFGAITGIAICGAVCLAPIGARAQDAGGPLVTSAPKAERADNVQTILLRNVPPDLMAWWLDPSHNPEPFYYAVARRALRDNRSLATGAAQFQNTATAAGWKAAPDDGEIRAVNSQNLILLVGMTAERTREIERIVALIDWPLRQIEITAQFIEADSAVARRLEAPVAIEGQLSFKIMGDRAHAALGELSVAKKLTILSAPRVTAIDNLAASLGNAVSTPSAVTIKGQTARIEPGGDGSFFLQTRNAFMATPHINADDTISLNVSLTKALWLMQGESGPSFDPAAVRLGVLSGQAFDAKLRNGATLIVAGLPRDLLPTSGGKVAPTDKFLLLLTARIVRRLESDRVAAR